MVVHVLEDPLCGLSDSIILIKFLIIFIFITNCVFLIFRSDQEEEEKDEELHCLKVHVLLLEISHARSESKCYMLKCYMLYNIAWGILGD